MRLSAKTPDCFGRERHPTLSRRITHVPTFEQASIGDHHPDSWVMPRVAAICAGRYFPCGQIICSPPTALSYLLQQIGHTGGPRAKRGGVPEKPSLRRVWEVLQAGTALEYQRSCINYYKFPRNVANFGLDPVSGDTHLRRISRYVSEIGLYLTYRVLWAGGPAPAGGPATQGDQCQQIEENPRSQGGRTTNLLQIVYKDRLENADRDPTPSQPYTHAPSLSTCRREGVYLLSFG